MRSINPPTQPGVNSGYVTAIRWLHIAWLAAFIIGRSQDVIAEGTNSTSEVSDVQILWMVGTVEVARAGSRTWERPTTNTVLHVGDTVRTRENSRAALLLSDKSLGRIAPLTELAIERPVGPNKQARFSLPRGLFYFFHRDKPSGIRIDTRTAAAAIEGTEFNLEAADSGATILTTLDGAVELSNELGRTMVLSQEQGVAEPGKPPRKTALIDAVNVIQWVLYYPAVLDLDDLDLSRESQALDRSLTAYRAGDLLEALAQYPAERTPASEAEKIYYGALLLAVGQVEQTETLLASLSKEDKPGSINTTNRALAGAIRQLIAAVKFQPWQREHPSTLATEWLAESYYQQSRAQLPEALAAARKAVEGSPNFGFGWARLAELEFSFGHTGTALEALNRSLALAPRNAEALALKGFLLSS